MSSVPRILKVEKASKDPGFEELPTRSECKEIMLGGPTSIFFEHLSPDDLVDDLVGLYIRLVDLGFKQWNRKVYLDDISESSDTPDVFTCVLP